MEQSALSEETLDNLASEVMQEDALHRWGNEAWQCRPHDLVKALPSIDVAMSAVRPHLDAIYGRFKYRVQASIMRCQIGYHVAEHIASSKAGLNTVLFLDGDFKAVPKINTRTAGCMVINSPAKRLNSNLLPWEEQTTFAVTPKRGLIVSMPLDTPHGYFPLRDHTKDTLAIEFHSFPVPEVDHA